ncbi:endolytic transglycosylase MltG, partial [Rhizobium leguminosarum]|uniref:endolytic transglycosylase MltG n=1 Tax=Rhizobium leguminosarum TaxID=384 RepID=UPI003F998EAF
PTIIYVLFGGAGKPADRPLYPSDLKRDTPYNTYVITGLPPTPIANPGKESLEAVANPWKTQDLYFVADGTGGHVFSATLEEHNANVKRWRKLEADKGADPNIAVDG